MSPSALLGASAAVLLLRPAHGLGVGRLAQPRRPQDTQRAKRTGSAYIEDVIATFMDADEDDAFDTWLFEGHAEDVGAPSMDDYVMPAPGTVIATDDKDKVQPATGAKDDDVPPVRETEDEEVPPRRDAQGRPLWDLGQDKTRDRSPRGAEGDATWRRPSKEELALNDRARAQCALPKNGKSSQGGMENAVITYLVTRESDLLRLSESLPRLRYFFLQHWPYPVRVFVASQKLRKYDKGSFGNSPDRENVTKLVWDILGNDYQWKVTTFDVEFPKVIADDPAWKDKMNPCAQAVSTSYKHMNQFFTMAMYEHEAMQDFRYYMRVDADFQFERTIKEDPFCMMKMSGRKFTWQTRKKVFDGFCSEGLWEWFHKYQEDHGLTPQDPSFFRESGAMVNYVGYVGMGDLDFFRSEQVHKLAEALNEDGRIYLNRWSDQTYYPLLLGLFENHSAVGEVGFDWPGDTWCHKCPIPVGKKFNPETGSLE